MIIHASSAVKGTGSLEAGFYVHSAPDGWYDPVWDLGDGIISRDRTPVHNYVMPGVYSVCCRYRIPDSDTVQVSNTVTIRVLEPVIELDSCYRIGLNNEVQGNGPCEYQGDYWPSPEPLIGGQECFDDRDLPRRIVFDALTGTWREISTYNGPQGSGIERVYTDDRYDADTDSGVPMEISWDIELPGVTGAGENHELEHIKTFLFFRPDDEMRGAAGYDENGYRDGLQLDVTLCADGESKTAEALRVPYNGEVVFDIKRLCRRARILISGTASHLFFVGYRQFWWVQDHDRGPQFSTTTEVLDRDTLSAPTVWLCRVNSRNRLVDRTSGLRITADLDTVRSASENGPDGRAGTVILTGDQILTFTIPSLSSGMVLFWGDADAVMTVNSTQVILTSKGVANGYTLFRGELSEGGPAVIESEKVFDLRIFSTVLESSVIDYYSDDVVSRSGETVLPLE